MYGYAMNKEDFQARLAKVEGQVRGLQRMIDEDKYCIDILTQLNATTAALKAIGIGLLDDHVRHCVREERGTRRRRRGDRAARRGRRAFRRTVTQERSQS